MKLGEPLPKRQEKIKQLRSNPSSQTEPIKFQGRRQNLPVYTVSVDFPKYRLENGRTKSVQAAYLANHPDIPKDFFTRDFEDETVQKVQHEILKEMLGDDSNRNLLKYFKKHEQEKRFILSDLGYVVDGNRRLCAFRELIQEDPVTYSHLQNIEVVILPPAEDKDIDKLEATLQITDDIKADYTWTAQAFMLRERRDLHGFSERELADLFGKTEAEIRELLDMLSLAEAYLEDRNKPFQYPEVEKSEFAFRQLRNNRQKFKDDEAAKDAFDRLSYCLIDKPGEGRVYAAIPDIFKNFNKIAAQIQEEIPIEKTKKEMSGKYDLLGKQQSSSLTALVDVLGKEEHYDRVREVISDVIQSEKAKVREEKKEAGTLSSIAKAIQNLKDALRTWDDNIVREEIVDQLSEVEALAKSLLNKLN